MHNAPHPHLIDPTRQSQLQRIKNVLAGWGWPTLGLFAGCIVFWVFALMLPTGWGAVSFAILTLTLTLHSSLSHEILHGHPFRSERASTVLGMIQPGLFVPYLRFKYLHLAHHQDENLTDPYDDPETNYLDPQVWAKLPQGMKMLLAANNTLLGRMVLGPMIGTFCFVKSDIAKCVSGDRRIALDWLLHVPGVVLVLWLVTLSPLSLWIYLAACYAALSILKIRTFLEHQAHVRASGRSVVVEDRGLLALLFLNNNLHVVHHMHPNVSWYRLPALYRTHKDRYLRRNHGYVYRSYGQVFRQFLVRTKDPVAHPLWQPRAD
ncbi:MAG: fatty acid desaturase [Sulfitobacter sp.]